MDKKEIKKQQYTFLYEELDKHRDEERISENQMKEIMGFYEVKEGISFIQVLVMIGSILIGLGVLTFIASNWIYLSKLMKFSLIIFGYIAAIVTSMLTERRYPKTSISLIYLGILIFGAGIFLVGQVFHFGGTFTNAFLLWSIGIYPLVMLKGDKWAFAFLHGLLLVYLNGFLDGNGFPYIMLAIVPFLYLGQKAIKADWIVFITNIITLNLLWHVLMRLLHIEPEIISTIFFAIGLLMYFVPIPFYSKIIKLQGNLVFAIFGFILTFKGIWHEFSWVSSNDYPVHIIFAIIYFILLLYLVRIKNLVSLIFIGVLILRFYFDTMYDFLPKSIFFISGGIFMLAYGFYFEKQRRKLRGEEDEI